MGLKTKPYDRNERSIKEEKLRKLRFKVENFKKWIMIMKKG